MYEPDIRNMLLKDVNKLSKLIKSKNKTSELFFLFLNNPAELNYYEDRHTTKMLKQTILARNKEGFDPVERWFYPEDIWKYVPDENTPETVFSKYKVSRDIKPLTDIKILNHSLIQTITLKEGKYSNMGKHIIRIDDSEETLIICWLACLKEGRGSEFMQSYYYKNSPHVIPLITPFLKELGYENSLLSYISEHKDEYKPDHIQGIPVNAVASGKIYSLKNNINNEYYEWINDIIKIPSLKVVGFQLKQITDYNNSIGMTKDIAFEHLIKVDIGYDKKKLPKLYKKMSLIEYLRTNPKKKQLLIEILKKTTHFKQKKKDIPQDLLGQQITNIETKTIRPLQMILKELVGLKPFILKNSQLFVEYYVGKKFNEEKQKYLNKNLHSPISEELFRMLPLKSNMHSENKN
ncbi:MAG: hypothetical protein ACP5NV_02860 [Candidatus Woesearchaeota archaeon]